MRCFFCALPLSDVGDGLIDILPVILEVPIHAPIIKIPLLLTNSRNLLQFLHLYYLILNLLLLPLQPKNLPFVISTFGCEVGVVVEGLSLVALGLA